MVGYLFYAPGTPILGGFSATVGSDGALYLCTLSVSNTGKKGSMSRISGTTLGTAYMVASGPSREDNAPTISVGYYSPAAGFSGWFGTPRSFRQFGFSYVSVVTSSSEDAVYVGALDTAGAAWMARFDSSGWGTWYTAPGVFRHVPGINGGGGPQLATGSGQVFAVGLDPNGGVWFNTFAEGTSNGCGTWTYADGVLAAFAPAIVQGRLYITGESADQTIWWHSSATGWTPDGVVTAPPNITVAPHWRRLGGPLESRIALPLRTLRPGCVSAGWTSSSRLIFAVICL